MRLIVSPGDWNGDGRPVILAANAAGQLFQYLGNGAGGVRARGQVGRGWSGIAKLVAVGDWDGDRRVDVVGMAAGAARLYRGTGTGRFAGTQALSGDWSRFATVVGVSDTDRDGRTEVLGVGADGVGWLGRRVGAADLSWSRATPSFAGLAVYGG
ncbi:MAG: VCBS repeat-containing protein, partial [Deltaproteobacteria bacterium]|nr:VCBS repeat-containing protein [Deltaproteobacteria bacterium]